MYRVKPHHFIDIIKLYGGGRDVFVPDHIYGHSFYIVANAIMVNPSETLCLTLYDDDICNQCKYKGADGACLDTISHIERFTSKDEYNKMIDKRIFDFLGVDEGYQLSAYELCQKLYEDHNLVSMIWLEDVATITRRQELFLLGLAKYREMESISLINLHFLFCHGQNSNKESRVK